MSEISEGILLGLGHPLLDIICSVDSSFLSKYKLKANDSIRVNQSHQKLYKEIIESFECQYITGGSVQNSLRAAQWMLNKANCMTLMGAIGDDNFGKIMMKKINEQGVNFVAKIDKTTNTGISACLISDNGKNRSLIAHLGASQNITIKHLKQNYNFVEKAKYFYTSGYHLGIDFESVMDLALHSHKTNNKMFCLNLSASYVSQKLYKPLLQVFPYVDLLFANETEIQAFAELNGWQTKDIKTIAKLTANKECKRKTGRTVVITQGKDSVLVADTKNSNQCSEFFVKSIEDKYIADTIGAGDAFVGGFFAQLVQNKSLDVCIESGIYCAQEVIKQIGCQFPKHMSFV